VSLAIGFTLGGQIGGRAVDRIYHRLKKRNGGEGKPGQRLRGHSARTCAHPMPQSTSCR
jgi:hypothetical protein